TMLYRNLLAMDAEELLRGHPVDGVVLMGGCDKTTPALLLGAISMNIPAIYMPAGPMLRGNWKGKVLGSGSDAWKYWDERRAGQDIGLDDFERASRKVPVIANIRPSGDKYLMEDFFYAGGLPGLLERIRAHLHLDCLTVTGKTIGENIKGAEVYADDVIRPID